MKNISMRILSHVIMAYMLLAFGWWALLLHRNTDDTYVAKKELLRTNMLSEGLITGEQEFELTKPYLELKAKRESQTKMIIGEAGVFIITLLIGLWLINKGYDREIKANEQRRNFLLSITHELKSPLASVRLILETFLKRELPRHQVLSLSKNALDENERLYELVENLLLSARLESHYNPFFEELDLVTFIEVQVAKQKVKYPKAEIKFLSQDNFPIVKMEKRGMWSVITNLIENAIKYSNGKVQVEITLSQKQGNLILEVADQGTGIPISERKRIFEKFYRIGSEETRKSKGTGLGLYIVDQIVKAHNGKIQVSDNKPRGTIFNVQIPV